MKEMDFIENLEIRDNGGKTLDRYTILELNTGERSIYDYNEMVYDAITASATGGGVYLHTHATGGDHLGEKIPFTSLDHQLQKKLTDEFRTRNN